MRRTHALQGAVTMFFRAGSGLKGTGSILVVVVVVGGGGSGCSGGDAWCVMPVSVHKCVCACAYVRVHM